MNTVEYPLPKIPTKSQRRTMWPNLGRSVLCWNITVPLMMRKDTFTHKGGIVNELLICVISQRGTDQLGEGNGSGAVLCGHIFSLSTTKSLRQGHTWRKENEMAGAVFTFPLWVVWLLAQVRWLDCRFGFFLTAAWEVPGWMSQWESEHFCFTESSCQI